MAGLKSFPMMLAVVMVVAGSVNAAETLVWSDEFDGTSVDTSKWVYDVGGTGWGNSELQYYTDGLNVSVSGGSLIIQARSESYGGKSFTSARMKTKDKFSFQYGAIEFRVKIPNLANGLWPALWMMGTNGLTWPANGEIDVMEMGSAAAIAEGTQNRRSGSACHWESGDTHVSYGNSYTASSALNTAYHIWRATWTPTRVRVSLDGTEYYVFDISGGAASDLEEFRQPFYILMNMAVGGSYTGIYSAGGITAPLPANMYVDYVRVYQDTDPPLSQFKTATASSEQLGNGAVCANDSDTTTTRWAAANSTYPQWWKVDLGTSYNLSRVDINWYNSASRAYQYKIEVSANDSTYATVVDKTSNTTYGDTSDSFVTIGRYVRVTVTGCTSPTAFASAYEIKVFGGAAPPSPTLLSQAQPATASSQESSSRAPAKGNDGDFGTRWAASSSSYPQWWKVDLGSSRTLTRMDIYWLNAASRWYKYKIEVSTNDSTYTTVVDKTNNTTYGNTSDSFSATARYVRVTITGASGGSASAYEFQVYGY